MKVILTTACMSIFVTSVFAEKCSVPTSTSYFISVTENHAQYNTADGNNCETTTPLGEGCIIFPPSDQAHNTKLKERPRNNACTYEHNGYYVLNSSGGGVQFDKNPACNDSDYGYWQYEVPTASQIINQDYNHQASAGTSSQGLPYIAIGWAAFVTLAGANCSGLECYEPYVIYTTNPDDGTDNVYISETCSD